MTTDENANHPATHKEEPIEPSKGYLLAQALADEDYERYREIVQTLTDEDLKALGRSRGPVQLSVVLEEFIAELKGSE